MQTVTTIQALREVIAAWRMEPGTVALVPTMGNLHDGHLRLVRHARACADRVVASVFVNPLQFGPGEDYARYPVTHAQDQAALSSADTDLLFMPDVSEVYGDAAGEAAQVSVPHLNRILEGEFRPTHFDGVTTVVAKLFNMVQPDVAVFGEKDYQQLVIIRRMVADLDMPIRIEGVATVREADGLAMSSRNAYLAADERARAPQLYQVLQQLVGQLQQGGGGRTDLEVAAMGRLREAGFEPDYVAVRRCEDLAVPETLQGALVVLAAARLGTTRLIDNISVSVG